ncbi:MAG: SDR family oxidoreductase, partial [Pseudomonas putida]
AEDSGMLLLNAQDIRDCTDITELLAVLARDYRASVRTPEKVPPRHVIEHPAQQAFSLFMPAVLSDRKVMGIKVSSFFPGNANRGLPAINGAVLLLDSDTGRLQAMLDGCALTALRTAAMSALATDRLCPVAQPTLAVIGAGVQAKAHIEAMAEIRALRRVRVVARDLVRCHAFAVSMSEQVGVPVEAVKSIEQALLDADIVCTTTSHDSPTELTDLFKQLALDHPPINCLVNSIGIDGRSFTMTEDYPEADFDDVMSTNVRAPWQCMKAVLPAMREAGHGTIVNVASLAGLNASVTGGSVYTASKHALVGITRAVAKEYAPYGVRVNAVCPGFVSTPLAKHVLGSKFDSVCASQPMRRVCEAHEVAELVYWLSSEAASYVTGVAVPIDGGFRA